MRIFVIHKGEDFDKVIKLKEKISETIEADILILESDKKFKSWKSEARFKIKICDLVLYALGENTNKSENVDYEIKYSRKKHKQILLYNLDSTKKYAINKSLFRKDKFTGMDKPLFKEIELKDLTKILKYGYDFDIKDTLEKTFFSENDISLVEQYKSYLQTSEQVLNRRQAVSNFYTTLNTSLLTTAATISGIIFGIESLKNNFILGCGITILISLIGILLSFNWIKLLESYGSLNGAKIKVLAQIEKKLPVNIFDTEWKIMSEKLGEKNYVSFTSIEKRVPKIFITIYFILICLSLIILFVGII